MPASTRDVIWIEVAGNPWTQDDVRHSAIVDLRFSLQGLPATSIQSTSSVGAGMGSNLIRSQFCWHTPSW